MTRRSSRRAGMTLVETLVAFTLLGMFSLGLVTALQTGVGAWRDSREAVAFDRRIANANNLLHAELAGLVPVVAQPPPNRPGVPMFPFFHGGPSQMRFVSAYSLQAGVRSGLRLVELSVIDGDEGRRLILNELPYRGPRSLGGFVLQATPDPTSFSGRRLIFAPVRARADSLIAADRLRFCRFSYLRYPRLQEDPGEWVPVWDDWRRLPVAVRVEMAPAALEAGLQPVTVTAQIRAEYREPDNADDEELWLLMSYGR